LRPALGALCTAGVSAFLASAAGCGGEFSATVGAPADAGNQNTIVVQGTVNALPPFFDSVVHAPYRTAFRGIRRVAMHRGSVSYEYLEEVGADGTGKFAVAVLEVLAIPPTLEPALAPLLLGQRARFGYRVRDPHFTDLELLAQNWRVLVVARDVVVAGHPCWRVELERFAPLGLNDARYELDIEPRTGLVLAWRERDARGQLQAEVAYETLAFDADVQDMDLRDRDFAVSELDPLVDFTSQVGAEARLPSLAPPGFELARAELLRLPTGEEWVKFVFTDGFERAFFLHRLDRSDQVEASSPGSARLPSHVDHAPFGPWTFAVGEVSGVSVIAAGKVPARYLGELIQSAVR